MKQIALLTAIIGLLLNVDSVIGAPEPQSPLSLIVQSPSGWVDGGSPVDVLLILKNTGDSPVQLKVAEPDWDFSVQVFDSQGNELPVTRYRRFLDASRGRSGHSVQPKTLKAGEEIQFVVRVSRQYDMTLQSDYYKIKFAYLPAARDSERERVDAKPIVVRVKRPA